MIARIPRDGKFVLHIQINHLRVQWCHARESFGHLTHKFQPQTLSAWKEVKENHFNSFGMTLLRADNRVFKEKCQFRSSVCLFFFVFFNSF